LKRCYTNKRREIANIKQFIFPTKKYPNISRSKGKLLASSEQMLSCYFISIAISEAAGEINILDLSLELIARSLLRD
jgi:hypothetical protein